MKRLAILGASGHGKVVADAAEAAGWQEIVFFDDAWPDLTENGPWLVKGNTDTLMEALAEYDGVVVGIGNNAIRAGKQLELSEAGATVVKIIHPAATVSPHVRVGIGSVVFAQAVVNACATVGTGAIVNTGSVVEHDCVVGDFSHISPNAVLAGGVRLGTQCWVGAGASVRQLLEIGKSAVVGMGAVVTKNISAGSVVAGNPAKVLKS
ncbi:MAG: Trimeric LpxA-like family protein [Marinobacter sp. T13-3]|nr:MAG: Trimeric LpxA-like family protein [Marinobacter sp. T13-3]